MAFSTLGIAIGLGLLVLVLWMHVSEGTGWEPTRNIADEIMEHRAATVTETDFPEPGSRSLGGGGAVAIGAGEAGELEEGAEEEADLGPAGIPDDEAETYEIEFVKEGATIEVKENENLLEAGEDEGWDLPYACREGQCISCGAHTPDGSANDLVIHHNQSMLGDEELDDGYILTCCAYPVADFTLETRESP